MTIHYGRQITDAVLKIHTLLKQANLKDAELIIKSGDVTIIAEGLGACGTMGAEHLSKAKLIKHLSSEINHLQDSAEEEARLRQDLSGRRTANGRSDNEFVFYDQDFSGKS